MNPIVIIGLDGATFDVLNKFSDKLPILGKIMREDVKGKLETTIPPLTGPAWVSLSTGKNPGKHGIFSFYEYPRKANSKFINSNSVKEMRLWDYLDGAGLKSCYINVPVTYPPQKINGVMVSSFLTPSLDSEYTYPSNIKNKLNELGYEIDVDFETNKGFIPLQKRSEIQEKRLYDRIIEVAEKRTKSAKELAKQTNWDLFFVMYKETDLVQHFFYDHEESLLNFYIFLDNQIQNLMNSFPKNTNFIFVSDHGFGKSPKVAININHWLKETGFLVEQKMSKIQLAKLWAMKRGHNITRKLGINMLHFFPKALSYFQTTQKKANVNQDILVYPAGIVINENLDKLKAKELKEKLIINLRELKYLGKPVFQKVKLREELYQGDFVDRSFDIILVPNQNFQVEIDLSAKNTFSNYEAFVEGSHDHALFGIFLATGPDMKQGFELNNAQIIDIVPTILHMFNIPIPEDIDGKVLKDIFSEKSKLFNQKIEITSTIKEDLLIKNLNTKRKI